MKYLKKFNQLNESIDKSYINEICDYLEASLKDSKLINLTLVNISNISGAQVYEYILFIDNKEIIISYQYKGVGGIFLQIHNESKVTHSTRLLNAIKDYTKSLIYLLGALLVKELSISLEELIPRLDEFDIINDNKIDLISLNTLYDYYGKKFVQSTVNKKLKTILNL